MSEVITITASQLKSIIERVERLESDKKGIADDIKEVYAESKGNGFDPKIIKAIVKLRRLSKPERDEQESLIDTYKEALGIK